MATPSVSTAEASKDLAPPPLLIISASGVFPRLSVTGFANLWFFFMAASPVDEETRGVRISMCGARFPARINRLRQVFSNLKPVL